MVVAAILIAIVVPATALREPVRPVAVAAPAAEAVTLIAIAALVTAFQVNVRLLVDLAVNLVLTITNVAQETAIVVASVARTYHQTAIS